MSEHPTTDQVLALIRTHITQHGYPPSIRWLAEAADTSPTTAFDRVEELEREGRIIRVPNRARAITINEGDPE
jgi:SOS-response transcriptional repressor LexA